MKKLFLINDTFENKISYYLLACFLVALPFDHFYSEWLLIIFCIHTLIHLKKNNLHALRNTQIWIVASLFFLNAAAIAYSNYPTEGYKDSVQQLGILLFPVFISLNNTDFGKYKFLLLEIFGLSCTITILYLYFDAFRIIHYFHLSWSSLFSRNFINHNFSAPVGLHATYLSMYTVLSISAFLFLFSRNPVLKNLKYIFYSLILLAGLIQLSSRSAFLSMSIIFVFGVPALLLQGKKKLQFFMASILGSVLIFLFITQVASFKKRYVNDLENDLSENSVSDYQSESRIARWGLEWELIQKFPFTGYGTGSEKDILKEKYFENKFYISYLLELNAHNQYLSLLINTGIVGLLLYLYVLYFGFEQAIKRRDFLLLSFMIIITVVSVSENILDVNKGILFYAFFYSFFLLSIQKKIRMQHTDQNLYKATSNYFITFK
jgi:O-antigen ligase